MATVGAMGQVGTPETERKAVFYELDGGRAV